MARKLDLRVGSWLMIAALVAVGATAVYFLGGRLGLSDAYRMYVLGLLLGAMACVIYLFSVRKWGLVLLYRYGVLRPAERAQGAVELARADLSDLQNNEVDTGRLTAKGDMVSKANAILVEYNVDRALQAVVKDREGTTPKIEFVRRQSGGKLDSYLYAHAAIGFAAIAVTLYHANWHFGGLVSGGLLVVWLGACLTGVYGGYLYWVMPSKLAKAEVKLGFDETRRQIERIDHEIAEVGAEKPELKKLLEMQRVKLEAYYKPQARRKLGMESWLWVHIPLATAALVLLVFHVASVWYY